MNWAVISLIGLLIIIVVANVRSVNVGLMGLGMALFIGTIGGMKLKTIYGNFDLQLFLRMLSIQVLVVVAKTNGTLEVVGNGVLRLCQGKRIRILPIILYIGIGLGTWFQMGIGNVIAPLIFVMAYEMGFKDSLKLGFVTFFRMFAWGLAPYSMQGVNLATYAEAQGYTLNMWHGGLNMLLSGTLLFAILYFYYGWHKQEPIDIKAREGIKIGRTQILTLLAFAAFIICNLFFNIDIMITPLCVSLLLMCFGCADPGKVMRGIPWSTLMMFGGMSVYVGVVSEFGGVELIAAAIAAVANKFVAPAIMTIICGLMSIFASGNGVVIPTMTATISNLAASIPGLNVPAMFWAVVIGANATAISPMSTIGANTMSYYAACYNPTEEENKKMFNKLLMFAAIILLWSALTALVGITSVFQ